MALASSVKILIAGKELPDFIDIQLQQNIYEPHSFRINCYLFTHEDINAFMLEKSKDYIGADISITIEEDAKGQTGPMQGLFFKGVITELNASRSEISDQDYLVISGFSPDILLNETPVTRSFENKSLKQIVDDVLKPYPKNIIKSKITPKHSGQLPYVVQYNESNYDFLRRMAARFGEWFFYNGEELLFGNPTKGKQELVLGINLMDFEFSMKLAPVKFKWLAHDYFKNEMFDASSNPDGSSEYGKHAVSNSTKRFMNKGNSFINSLNVPEKENYNNHLTKAVDTEAGSKTDSLTFGNGNSTNIMIRVGNKADIKALNSSSKKEINYGSYLITSIMHQCDEVRNYTNSFSVLPIEAKLPETVDPTAVAYCKTQSALVTDNKDPEKMGRIKVRFWWQESSQSTPWLRIVTPYTGGKDHGFYIIPEIDDEVIVGFEADNAEKPYIIGSIYNGVLKPDPEWYNEKNDTKFFRTKSGNTIKIVDKGGEEEITLYLTKEEARADGKNEMISIIGGKKPSILIESTGDLTIKSKTLLLDVEESITMQTNSKDISLAAGTEIKMDAKTNISAEAKANFTAKATANFSAEAQGNMDLSGLKFSAKGDTAAALEGLQVSVKGSAQTEIKGGMVMIN